MRKRVFFLWLIFSMLCSGCLSSNRTKQVAFTDTPTELKITVQPPTSTRTLTPTLTKLPSPTSAPTFTPTLTSTPSPSPTIEDPFTAFCENPQTLADLKDARIAFIADWDGKMKIYTIHPDGSDLVKLSGKQAVDGWPVAWSPDGKRIAFAIPDTYADQFIVEPRPPGQGQLFIMNVDGTGGYIPAPELPIIPEAEIAWSPDSQHLAFGGNLSGKGGTFLYAMQADGSDQKRLTDSNVGFAFGWASWSADGKRVAYAQVYDRYGHTYLGVGASDHKDYQLINFTSEYSTLGDPGWSPVDVNLLAFQGYTFTPWGCGRQLYLKNLKTEIQTQITGCGDVSNYFWWSPDGNLLAYTTAFNDRPTLNLYHLPTDQSQVLLTFPTGITSLAWSPDSHWMAYTRWKEGVKTTKGSVDLYLLNVCDSTLLPVVENISVKYDIFWMP